MRVYENNVISTVVWGAGGWLLTKKIQAQLNIWNTRCVSNITGKTPHGEASVRKQSMEYVPTGHCVIQTYGVAWTYSALSGEVLGEASGSTIQRAAFAGICRFGRRYLDGCSGS